jgi:MFS family permease
VAKKSLNLQLIILLTTNGLILLAVAMLGPIYALFVQKVGGSLLDASLAGGVFALVAGLTSLLSGKYTDRLKNKKIVIVFGYFVMGISFVLYIWVNSVIMLFMVQALIGLAQAIYSPAFDALYSKYLDGNKAGLQWGAWESINFFTASGGAILGGILVTKFGFNTLFIVMALLCFSSGLYIHLVDKKVM